MGRARRVRTSRREVVTIVIMCIASTWICTKSYWFLRPGDELLSFRSCASEPWGPTKDAKVSSFRYWRVSLGK